jgi:SARP family transcriptional regulator, regulator of embCAB operon
MPLDPEIRIQLCGKLAVNLNGKRIEGGLPGRKGRMLFGYLAVNRTRSLSRDELIEAVWGEEVPASSESDLSAMLSKIRKAIGPEHLEGRSELRLRFPLDAFVDVEAALDAIHRAETFVANAQWTEAYAPSATAIYIPVRGFLKGLDAPWIDEWRRRLDDVLLRGLEAHARSNLELGGASLVIAEQTASTLIEKAPFRETGYRLLMTALERKGNIAEGLRAYERLRSLLREELGVAPSPAVQEVHMRLLEATGEETPRKPAARAPFKTKDERVLATILFTDIVDSTVSAVRAGDRRWRELLDSHDSEVRRELEHFGGREIKTTGDGFLATFDGPARAIHCANSIRDCASSLGLEIRAGIHTGELELRGADVGGVAVHIGARILSLAQPGEILVSSTVRALVHGSGLEFDNRGLHSLKGVPEKWEVFSVEGLPDPD